jgi:Ribbon-helix-helix protein, copG family
MKHTIQVDIMKMQLGRVSLPSKMIEEVRPLAQWEHASITQFVRQAVQQRIDFIRRKKLRYEAQQQRDYRS